MRTARLIGAVLVLAATLLWMGSPRGRMDVAFFAVAAVGIILLLFGHRPAPPRALGVTLILLAPIAQLGYHRELEHFYRVTPNIRSAAAMRALHQREALQRPLNLCSVALVGVGIILIAFGKRRTGAPQE